MSESSASGSSASGSGGDTSVPSADAADARRRRADAAPSEPASAWLQFRALIYKNMLLKRRNIGTTIGELIFPVYIALFLMLMKTCVRAGGRGDENGTAVEDFGPEKMDRSALKGDRRTLRLRLDTAQYQADADAGNLGVYDSFNIVMRRQPKENNFKGVVETIRDLMFSRDSIPAWFRDVLLGYGDPAGAHYSNLGVASSTIDFYDTFIDLDHLRGAFPGREIVVADVEGDAALAGAAAVSGPFRVTFPELAGRGNDEATPVGGAAADGDALPPLTVTPYVTRHVGPYPRDVPRKNAIPFTPTQVEAIKSGVSHGLTMIVGPPGTGKTDVAVQMVSVLYHNFPDQRILLVTHSNNAMNQLFEKIAALDIDERHLLRLGHAADELETEEDFSKWGRVNHMLSRRLHLLKQLEGLASAMGLGEDQAYTCETAELFDRFHVRPAWVRYAREMRALLDATQDDADAAACARVAAEFPYAGFFEDTPAPLFAGSSLAADWAAAQGARDHVCRVFEEVEECRAFELLRSGRDRGSYLLTTQARIIAMTCTHAALKRRDLVESGFKFDNIVMEEAAQVLEVETFVPMLLQEEELAAESRLKRIILIGDHNQLPPVIQNMAFQKFCHLDQSMFARFVRLGVPAVQLDGQGRARPSIAALYNWRYADLGDLPHTRTRPAFIRANAGLAHTFQFIDVPDLNGVGESTPSRWFYQNLAEAEYCVALYMYMRLLGYPAHKISMITTYNGQKALLRDVAQARCGEHPLFGMPAAIETVDKFQGQQNDYILVSLVRTQHVGHLRDVRRLVVAMSRSRLGCYVFGRRSLFEQCYELSPTFSQLLARPVKLGLVAGETFPTERAEADELAEGALTECEGLAHLGSIVGAMTQSQLAVTAAAEERVWREQLQAQEAARAAKQAAEDAEVAAARAKREAYEAKVAQAHAHAQGAAADQDADAAAMDVEGEGDE